jgi:cytochrome c biogenesis protein CcmG, thiol:disulfide interchange protein DsbE
MRRLLFILPVLLFLVLAGYFALALQPSYNPKELPSALIGKEAPKFALTGLNGEPVTLDTLKGKPVVLNFFASWCPPCRVEHPLLMRLSERDHLPLYGIAYRDQRDALENLLSRTGDPYRDIGMDYNGRVAIDFGVSGAPETFVLDRDGLIRKHFWGPLTEERVEKELMPLLKELGG